MFRICKKLSWVRKKKRLPAPARLFQPHFPLRHAGEQLDLRRPRRHLSLLSSAPLYCVTIIASAYYIHKQKKNRYRLNVS